jgi:hypothetical protein
MRNMRVIRPFYVLGQLLEDVPCNVNPDRMARPGDCVAGALRVTA